MENEISVQEARRLTIKARDTFGGSFEARRLLKVIFQEVLNCTSACKNRLIFTMPRNLGSHYSNGISHILEEKGYTVVTLDNVMGSQILDISW